MAGRAPELKQQLRKLDRILREHYGITLRQLEQIVGWPERFIRKP